MRPFVFTLFAEIFCEPTERCSRKEGAATEELGSFILHSSFFIKQKPPNGGFCGCGMYSCGSPAEKKLFETRRKGTRTLTV